MKKAWDSEKKNLKKDSSSTKAKTTFFQDRRKKTVTAIDVTLLFSTEIDDRKRP